MVFQSIFEPDNMESTENVKTSGTKTVKAFNAEETYAYLETVDRLQKALEYKKNNPDTFEQKAKIKAEYERITQIVKGVF